MLLFTKPKTRVGDITTRLNQLLKLEGVDDVFYSGSWNADLCDALCNCIKPFRLGPVLIQRSLAQRLRSVPSLTVGYIHSPALVTPSTLPFQSADSCGAW